MPGMQFPYPRKSSTSNPFGSTRSSSYRQRRALKTYGPPALGVAALLWFMIWLFSGGSSSISSAMSSGTPEVVIVTTLDPRMSERYNENIKENRREYAARYGYGTFFPNTTDYDLTSNPSTWSTVPALRHAMALYPHSPWLWYLASTALIMNTRESLQDKVLEPRKLESLMIVDEPVVPPDSVIKTLSHIRGERVDLVLTQDREGLAGGSIFLRTGDWAKFFLDSWFDPLYRSYNFQKAENHALEHIVQWHSTVLAKLALIPQRVINSYTKDTGGDGPSSLYHEGDFIVNFHGCRREKGRNCEEEMTPLMTRFREMRDREKKQ